MKIVVLSGGSGNDALVCGLKKLYKNCDVKVIVNAYDNGKSTGVCRQVTNTLGVSDIRKNHTRMYKAVCPEVNMNYLEFYDSRYDFTKGKEKEEIVKLLKGWSLERFIPFVDRFFKRPKAQEYEYKDFSVANIVYSQMYSEIGYEGTNSTFCDLLGIDDFVVLNSFDNSFIKAITKSGCIISDEGDIVEYKNADDPIVAMDYDGVNDGNINPEAVALIKQADLIIISTGTYWSSIYPTLQYGNFYQYINESGAKKIWAINNNEDKDSYGVTSNDFIEHTAKLGVNLDDFIILENADAIPTLREACPRYKVVVASMENNKGKHNGVKYARKILELYYGIKPAKEYDKIIFDFDDTLWARENTPDKYNYSILNIKLLNKLKNSCIMSGNSYESIVKKVSKLYGSRLKGFNVDIWADANSTLYNENVVVDKIESLMIKGNVKEFIDYMKFVYHIEVSVTDACLKIKPLQPLERNLLTDYLNDYLFYKIGFKNVKAYKTGLTTVDILTLDNNKTAVFNHLKLADKNTLYIGDEVDSGNDSDISKLCTTSIHTNGVEETNLLLKLLLGEE